MNEKKLKEAFAKIKQDIHGLKTDISKIKGIEKVNKKEIVVAASGYFDPIHKGHIECLELAKKLGDKLVVIVNSDEQAIIKKGYVFMPQAERMSIVKSLKAVDEAILSIDRDKSVCESLRFLKPDIFAKGGDRTIGEIPETKICRENNIKIVDGLGKKIQSSSELVKSLDKKMSPKKEKQIKK